MKITLPAAKSLILDVFNQTDDVTSEGSRVPRTVFKKQYFKGYTSLKNKILDQIRVGVVDAGTEVKELKTDSDKITWFDIKEWQSTGCPEGKVFFADVHDNQVEIELDSKEIEALRYYYEDREDLPPNWNTMPESEKALEEVEAAIAKS